MQRVIQYVIYFKWEDKNAVNWPNFKAWNYCINNKNIFFKPNMKPKQQQQTEISTHNNQIRGEARRGGGGGGSEVS